MGNLHHCPSPHRGTRLTHLSSSFWSRQHVSRGSSACLQGGFCSICVRSHGYSVAALLAYLRRAMVDVLHQIGDVAGIVSWLRLEELLRTAATRELGRGQPRFRDLVNLPADLWEYTVRDLCALHGEMERDLTVLEVGHVATLRRIVRPRLGLTAQVEVEDSALVVHSPRRRVRGLFPLGRLCRTNAQALGSPDPCVGPRARATSTGESTGNVYRLRQAARSRTPRGH